MKIYLDALRHVLENGELKHNRTGVDTLSVFGYQMRFDLSEGFPLVTTKRMFWKGIVHELLWMIRGETNIEYLNKHGVHIWDEWADKDGELGPVYGRQWRAWEAFSPADYIDQLKQAIGTLRADPDSRRIVVSAWNVADLPKMKLPPCHVLFQFGTGCRAEVCESCGDPQCVCSGTPRRVLNTHMFMRSADIFLGVPFNIASYALLSMLVAQVVGMQPGELVVSYSDLHLYTNHVSQAFLQLQREPLPAPKVALNGDCTEIYEFMFSDIAIAGYESHPEIKAEVAV